MRTGLMVVLLGISAFAASAIGIVVSDNAHDETTAAQTKATLTTDADRRIWNSDSGSKEVDFTVLVNEGEEGATVKVWKGTTILETVSITSDSPVSLTRECSKITISVADSTSAGTFQYHFE